MVDEAKPDSKVEHLHRHFYSRRQILIQIIIGTVILGSGIVIGVGGTILVMRDRIIWHPYTPDEPGSSRTVDIWKFQYNLTDEQARQIKEIFNKQLQNRHARFAEMFEKDQAEREQFVAAIKSILTPVQFRNWQQDFRRRSELYRRMGPEEQRGRGPRGQAGGPAPDRMGGKPPFGGRNPENARGPEPPPGPEFPPEPESTRGIGPRSGRGQREPNRPYSPERSPDPNRLRNP